MNDGHLDPVHFSSRQLSSSSSHYPACPCQITTSLPFIPHAEQSCLKGKQNPLADRRVNTLLQCPPLADRTVGEAHSPLTPMDSLGK